MVSIIAPEFRGNISGRFVLPELRAAAVVLILLLTVSAAIVPSQPSYAISKDGPSFSPITPVKCAKIFALPDTDGRRHALAAEKGRPVIVHFFATWCEPCKMEFASLQKFYKARSDQLGVVAVNVGEVPGRVQTFLKETPVDFPVLLDADRSITKAWAVESLPTSIVLDKALRPILAVNSDLDWTNTNVENEIETALANDPNSNGDDCTKEDNP